jgi:pimeloyl-ACP methyl ester carboxylesterase
VRWYGAADAHNLAPVVAFAGYEVAELQRRAHGLPVGNAELIYVGSGDDAALNDGVQRYRADTKAAAYLARWYTPTGKLTRPLLALHDTGDPLVPAYGANEYALAVQRAGHDGNFVQQYINREGHCVFTPNEIGRAFNEVVAWIDSGKPPLSGKPK